ncbi:NAD(P)H-dependent glycerol-3-phosphate dehydrogenase [Elizabethkingia sp. JS20170427COW]|uniref:NAD(P)H-dependent glycerol-3-phosphate dehydrogenase n=1 Tax=Elizabethkingia sp. JS20170427COW TaxID=2583851 RepID=UPI00111012D4|nr:NAD(P)H-dependent glycerol-3-phosphate dehydrogenase [Elizabethkingia sp. JS20170427COW]QCX54016.1 glycerol-3-phosphate dehydrogenase [Elizabethkingia sp. JS20170427COW]
MAKKKSIEGLNVGVVGSGSFATAIVKMLTENNKKIHWHVRNEFVKGAIELRKHNPTYLTAVLFNLKQLEITTDINALVEACDVIILATPSIYLGQTLANLTVSTENKIFVSAIKGIVPEQNDIVANFLTEKYSIPIERQAVISGPCHAEEVAMERLSYLTLSAIEESTQEKVTQLLESDYIKITRSNDIVGNEYSAVLKNIYAIGAGIASGLGYGDNFNAVLVSNAIREMEVYLDVIYPENRDVNESAMLGDLLVTCYSLFSRNRNLGNLIGKGYTVKSAIQSMNMVAEGYYATKSIYEIGKCKGLKLPIIKAVYEILFEEKNAEKQFKKLTAKLN